MLRPLLVLLLALGALATPAAAAVGEVYIRGTADGLVVRIPDADLADCEVLRPTPFRVILVVHDLALPSASPVDRFELARSVRVVGPDVLGGTDSRIVIELTTSLLEPSLEEVGSGVVLSLRAPLPEPLPAPEPAPPTVEAAEAPRRLATPWRRAREQAQDARAAARDGAAPVIDDSVDPADAERERRAAEEEERRRRREEREARVAAREMGGLPAEQPIEPSPQASPEATPAPRDEAAQPERQPKAPPVRRIPERRTGVQPSPATPVPGGMVRVAGGPFLMGSAQGEGFEDEHPQRLIDVDPFWIDSHEVTIGEFRHSPIRLPEQPAWNVDDDKPVLEVTWHEAAQYCDWLRKRLPTEAEWEKAARGEEGARYPWGDGWSPDFANSGVEGDGFEGTAPVGSFPDGASPYGALDLSGNAWEWTADWYEADAYDGDDRTNPTGPSRGGHKVARGGSYRGMYSVNVRSAIRLPLAPGERRDDVGFRCAADPR